MVDVINMFLLIFSGIVQTFTSIELGSYKIGSLLFGGFVVGVAITYVIRVIKR